MAAGNPSGVAVVCRVGTRLCALPIEHVVETMRPLPLEPFADMPAFVIGLSIIRGKAVPVVLAAALFRAVEAEVPKRLLTLKVGERCIALAVDGVVGIRDLSTQALADIPPLLQGASAEVVSTIGSLDSELLLVLRSGRVVPESVWAALEARADA
jgi:purine-binding chemotaxis protein CheW